jgi:hypothetical protein
MFMVSRKIFRSYRLTSSSNAAASPDFAMWVGRAQWVRFQRAGKHPSVCGFHHKGSTKHGSSHPNHRLDEFFVALDSENKQLFDRAVTNPGLTLTAATGYSGPRTTFHRV